jgi:hypothetical protein
VIVDAIFRENETFAMREGSYNHFSNNVLTNPNFFIRDAWAQNYVDFAFNLRRISEELKLTYYEDVAYFEAKANSSSTKEITQTRD